MSKVSAARFSAMREKGATFLNRGRDKGTNFDLEVAIEVGRLLVGLAQGAEQRLTALSDLAIALGELGQRENSEALLQESATAIRKTLQEIVPEEVPLLWAATQNNLGETLRRLGARGAGTSDLEAAAAA